MSRWPIDAPAPLDLDTDADDIAREYDFRAEVEPQNGEFKHGWDIGKVPSRDFHANHAMLLIKRSHTT